MCRRIVISAVVLLLLAVILTVVWTVCDWPPPGLVVESLVRPKGGPTGRTLVDPAGIEFVEIAAGGAWFRREDTTFEVPFWCRYLPFIDASHYVYIRTRIRSDRVDVGTTYWISRKLIPDEIKIREMEEAERADASCGFADELSLFDNGASLAWLISRLAARTGGRYRIPTRSEVLLAHATGGLSDSEDSLEVAVMEDGIAELWFRQAMLTTHLFLGGSHFRRQFPLRPTSRLVWIPPKDAE